MGERSCDEQFVAYLTTDWPLYVPHHIHLSKRYTKQLTKYFSSEKTEICIAQGKTVIV